MNRLLILLAAALAAGGCQNPAWQNPYAMIGPATVPPPGVQSVVPNQPQAAGARGSASSAAATGGAIRREITATPRASTPGSIEEPIRIVEGPRSTKTSSTKTIPPIVVAATPTSRSTAPRSPAGAAPAVKFNAAPPASGTPASSSPAIQRTRGYQPTQPTGQPATAPPKNRLSTPVPATHRDASVTPATFVETTTAASGQWKAR
jgi:hypothetical protein